MTSIPISLWIYRDLLGYTNFSVLNVISLFVIMGIGADDLFVFFDTYKVVVDEDKSIEEDRQARRGRSFHRAVGAMSVTSCR